MAEKVILTRQQLEDAARCVKLGCRDCSIKTAYIDACVENLAKTAIIMLDMLKKLEWKGVHSWSYEEDGCPCCGGRKADGHSSECEYGALLREMEGSGS